MRISRLVSLTVLASLLTISAAASARSDDCPPGSKYKAEEGYSYCEANVCLNDTFCDPGKEVCRPMGLCLEVGTLGPDASGPPDSGKERLVATQQCAPDKSCPQTTICSVMNRCIAKATAEKLGILSQTPAAPSAAPSGTDAVPAKKSACGCHAVGSETSSTGALAGVALALILSARRVRAGRRGSSPRAR